MNGVGEVVNLVETKFMRLNKDHILIILAN